MRLTIVHVKLLHTVIFAILSVCVLYILFSAAFNRITFWTWVAVVLVFIESIVFIVFGCKCPLTVLAERLGATRGSVVDIFLPKWFADRIFLLCGTTFLVACAILVVRVLAL